MAAGGGNGCQAAVPGGLLPVDEDTSSGNCAVGHLVGAGQVYNAEEGTGERQDRGRNLEPLIDLCFLGF